MILATTDFFFFQVTTIRALKNRNRRPWYDTQPFGSKSRTGQVGWDPGMFRSFDARKWWGLSPQYSMKG